MRLGNITAKGWIGLALALWLGGLSCVLGCAAEATAAGHPRDESAAAASDAGSCTDSCCQKGAGSAPPEHPAKEMDCCNALAAPGVMAKAPPAAVALAAADPVGAGEVAPSSHAFAAPDAFVVDSGGTYLKNRVLRI